MIRKATAALAVLALICGLWTRANAASPRQGQEIALDTPLRELVCLTVSAALMRGIDSLPPGEQPGQAITEGMLTQALFRQLLPEGGLALREGQARVSYAELADWYEQLFTYGTCVPLDHPLCPCLTVETEGLLFDLSPLYEDPVAGAAVYRMEENGEDIRLICDVFVCYQNTLLAEEVPEDEIVWLCPAEILLRPAPETRFGFTLSGFALGPEYPETTEEN